MSYLYTRSTGFIQWRPWRASRVWLCEAAHSGWGRGSSYSYCCCSETSPSFQISPPPEAFPFRPAPCGVAAGWPPMAAGVSYGVGWAAVSRSCNTTSASIGEEIVFEYSSLRSPPARGLKDSAARVGSAVLLSRPWFQMRMRIDISTQTTATCGLTFKHVSFKEQGG